MMVCCFRLILWLKKGIPDPQDHKPLEFKDFTAADAVVKTAFRLFL